MSLVGSANHRYRYYERGNKKKKKKQKQKILLKFIKTKEISAFSNKYKIGNNQRLKKKSKETHYKYNFRRGQKICTRFLFSFLFFDQIFIKLCKKKNGRQKIYLSFFCLFVFQQLLCLFFCGPLLFFFGSVLMTKSVVLTIVFSIVCFKAFFFSAYFCFFFPFFLWRQPTKRELFIGLNSQPVGKPVS